MKTFFSSSPEAYQEYCQKLRKEYGSNDYIKNRLKTLKALLMIPHIYSNEKFRDKFEKAARRNIQSEIDSMII